MKITDRFVTTIISNCLDQKRSIKNQGERFRKRRLLRLASPKRAQQAVCARSDSREAVRRKTQTWRIRFAQA